jgi:hypothetical protein
VIFRDIEGGRDAAAKTFGVANKVIGSEDGYGSVTEIASH